MEFLFVDVLDKPLWAWLAFLALIGGLLIYDLAVLFRKDHVVHAGESLRLTLFYMALALLFAGWIYFFKGATGAKEYLTGYFVEFSLSMDNVFVISLIFTYFRVPPQYQHRVLFYGILGVIILRGIMIALGATLVAEFAWILYIFAIFLVFTGVKMLVMGEHVPKIADNPILNFMKRHMNVTDKFHGHDFFVKLPHPQNKNKMVWWATPLFMCLVMVEVADLIFAVDSIPAIFAITQDAYIVYTSNIFAILGLRALYFTLADAVHRFKYLKPALACVLIFIGGKIFWTHLMFKVPASVSLGVTIGILAIGVFYSLYKTREHSHKAK